MSNRKHIEISGHAPPAVQRVVVDAYAAATDPRRSPGGDTENTDPRPTSATEHSGELGAVPGQLWCVHVYGPDSVIAQPNEGIARERAKAWQYGWDRYLATRSDRSPYKPTVTYVAEPWPHSAKSHAEALAEHSGDPREHC